MTGLPRKQKLLRQMRVTGRKIMAAQQALMSKLVLKYRGFRCFAKLLPNQKEPQEKRAREWLKTLAPYIAIFCAAGLVIGGTVVYVFAPRTSVVTSTTTEMIPTTTTVTTTQTTPTTVTTTSVSPTTVTESTTVTQTSTSTSSTTTSVTVTQTLTSIQTVSPPTPRLVTMHGRINITNGYATKIVFQNKSGYQHTYNVTNGSYFQPLENNQTWIIHAYWNYVGTGGGDAVCAVYDLNVGPGITEVNLDLKC